MPTDATPGSADPVLARRARLAKVAVAGKRVGYLILLIAVVAFFVGLAKGYEVAGPVVVVGLGLCTVILAPAMVLGYAVRAADRDEGRAPPR